MLSQEKCKHQLSHKALDGHQSWMQYDIAMAAQTPFASGLMEGPLHTMESTPNNALVTKIPRL